MRVLVAPQELKSTLRAIEAAHAIERGLAKAQPAWAFETIPLADGGPGTVDVVLAGVAGAHARTSPAADPLGREVEARWAILPPGDTAVIEMAAASGLWRVAQNERAPLDATTFGTGQLIRAALDAGCRRVIVGAGGSATNDGGAGAAAALGVRFLDERREELPPSPRQLVRCHAIDVSGRDPRLERASLEVWTDVRNPLLGDAGATRMYGAQKGATPDERDKLESCLGHLESLTRVQLGVDLAARPGAGAAGGLAWGLEAWCGATVHPGFLSLAELVRLDAAIERCDLVITAEGRLDAQTTFEKGPWGLARLARLRGKRVVAFVGRNDVAPEVWRARFDEVVVVGPDKPPDSAAAARRLEGAAHAWADEHVP